MLAILLVCCCSWSTYAQNVNFDWVIQYASPESRAIQVKADKDGNVYSGGWFNGAVDFNPGPDKYILTGDSTIVGTQISYTSNVFVSKVDAAGNFMWAKKFGGPVGGDRFLFGLTVDNWGNTYITGGYVGEISFDNITLTSTTTTYDIFVAKLDSSGAVKWVKSVGNTKAKYGYAIAADGLGNVYTTGYYQDTVSFGSFKLNPYGVQDIFVTKMDSDGNFLWAKGIGGTKADMAMYMTCDSLGYTYICGSFNTVVDFDPGVNTASLTSLGGNDAYILKLDPSGNFVWVNRMGGVGNDQANGITLDRFGNIYTTGQFMGTADFDPDTLSSFNLTSKGNTDIFIAKYDTTGKFVWAKSIGSVNYDYGWAISTDAVGNVYYGGSYGNITDFDPGPDSFVVASSITSLGSNDYFYSKLDSAGNFIWVNTLVVKNPGLWRNGIDVSRSGDVHIAYAFGAPAYPGLTVDFDPGPDSVILKATNRVININTQQEGGSSDGFILKLFCTRDSVNTDVINCEPYILKGELLSESGVYTATFTNLQGCDSIVTVNLTIELPEAIITVEVDTLSTTQSFATYQWIKDGAIIPSATSYKYFLTENGDYQVIVTNDNGCIDTSEVYEVRSVSIHSVAEKNLQIKIYPNPAEDVVYIESPFTVSASLSSIDGRQLAQYNTINKNLPLKHLSKGIYLLHIKDQDGNTIKTEKIVKQ